MKCPNCEYEDGWVEYGQDTVEGKLGEFYRSVLDVSRDGQANCKDTASVMGCPKCRIMFIDT